MIIRNNEPNDSEIIDKIKAISIESQLSLADVLMLAEWGCQKYNWSHSRFDQPFPKYVEEYTFEDNRFEDLPDWAAPILSQESKLERVIWSDGACLVRLKNSNRAVVAVEKEWES